MPVSHQSRRKRGNACKGHFGQQSGFSVIELSFVTVIILILSALAIPAMISSMRMAHLRGAASDLSGLYEQARIYAIRDNRYYSTYILAASGNSPQLAYVDMLPKSLTGASGNGGTSVVTGDPVVTLDLRSRPTDGGERAEYS